MSRPRTISPRRALKERSASAAPAQSLESFDDNFEYVVDAESLTLSISPKPTRRLLRRNNVAVVKKSNFEVSGSIEVLSIDDDPVNQMVVQEILQVKNYTVVTAMNAFEAMDLLKRRPYLPDVILLDMMMPGMSGNQLAEKLRAIYPTASLPIIMVSARSEESAVINGLQAGCNDYVTKPVRKRRLLASIETQLSFNFKVRGGKGDFNQVLSHTGAVAPGSPGQSSSALSLQEMLPTHMVEKCSRSGQRIVEDDSANVAVLYCLRQAAKKIDDAVEQKEQAEVRAAVAMQELNAAETKVAAAVESLETAEHQVAELDMKHKDGQAKVQQLERRLSLSAPTSPENAANNVFNFSHASGLNNNLNHSRNDSFNASYCSDTISECSTSSSVQSPQLAQHARYQTQTQAHAQAEAQAQKQVQPPASSSSCYSKWLFSPETTMTKPGTSGHLKGKPKWKYKEGGRVLEAVGSYALAALKPTFPVITPAAVTLEVAVTPSSTWGNATISMCHFKGESEAANADYDYWAGFCSDGDVFGVQGVQGSDRRRPKWNEGDKVRLTYDGKTRTVSYWHNDKIVLEGVTFKGAGMKMKGDDRLCFCFDSDGRDAKFRIIGQAWSDLADRHQI